MPKSKPTKFKQGDIVRMSATLDELHEWGLSDLASRFFSGEHTVLVIAHNKVDVCIAPGGWWVPKTHITRVNKKDLVVFRG